MDKLEDLSFREECIETRLYIDLPAGLIPGDIGCFGIKQLLHKSAITWAHDDADIRERLLLELEAMSVKIVNAIMEKLNAKRY